MLRRVSTLVRLGMTTKCQRVRDRIGLGSELLGPRRCLRQEGARLLDSLGAISVGEQAVVADFKSTG